ncbi:MAG: hypothetical protein V1783_01150, partial [Bacteroidota bacterium]
IKLFKDEPTRTINAVDVNHIPNKIMEIDSDSEIPFFFNQSNGARLIAVSIIAKRKSVTIFDALLRPAIVITNDADIIQNFKLIIVFAVLEGFILL